MKSQKQKEKINIRKNKIKSNINKYIFINLEINNNKMV
jgi:hypothetical protein